MGDFGWSLLGLALAVFAAARLTRLAGLDTVTAPLRGLLPSREGMEAAGTWESASRRVRAAARVRDFVECPWCLGFWVSLGVVWSWHVWGDRAWWLVGAAALATSFLVGATHRWGLPSQVETAVVGPVVVWTDDADPPADVSVADGRATETPGGVG